MAKSGSMSKLEYLKKYMDGGGADDNSKKEKKIKKKKKVKKVTNIKIIDNAIPMQNIDTNMNSEDEEEYELQEEKPLLFAEDGITVLSEQLKEERSSRWKPLKKNNEPNKSSKRTSQRHDSSDSDMSPERPKRISRRHDSDSDMSPARKPKNNNRHDTSDSDLSLVRRNNSEDLSPVQRKRHDSDDDMSPVRKKQGSDSDLSPKRTLSSTSSKRKELEPEVLSSGKGGGLKTGAELKRENDIKRKREKEMMENLHADISGKGAETIRRDKSGKKIDSKLEAIKKRKLEEEELEHQEKYAKWGKGLAQVDEFQNKMKDDLHEMDKPLARYKDDKDLDVLLRERDREGDPMLAFLSKNKAQVNTPAKPKYKGPTPAPNRFNIWPGYRYDGVDRSNGFEKRRYLEINKRKTHKTAAYKWSVEDM